MENLHRNLQNLTTTCYSGDGTYGGIFGLGESNTAYANKSELIISENAISNLRREKPQEKAICKCKRRAYFGCSPKFGGVFVCLYKQKRCFAVTFEKLRYNSHHERQNHGYSQTAKSSRFAQKNDR